MRCWDNSKADTENWRSLTENVWKFVFWGFWVCWSRIRWETASITDSFAKNPRWPPWKSDFCKFHPLILKNWQPNNKIWTTAYSEHYRKRIIKIGSELTELRPFEILAKILFHIKLCTFLQSFRIAEYDSRYFINIWYFWGKNDRIMIVMLSLVIR